jgi:hypothetical protein
MIRIKIRYSRNYKIIIIIIVNVFVFRIIKKEAYSSYVISCFGFSKLIVEQEKAKNMYAITITYLILVFCKSIRPAGFEPAL